MWISRGVDCWSAFGAKRLNLPNCEQDKESAIEFCFVGMCDALLQMFDLKFVDQVQNPLRLECRFSLISLNCF